MEAVVSVTIFSFMDTSVCTLLLNARCSAQQCLSHLFLHPSFSLLSFPLSPFFISFCPCLQAGFAHFKPSVSYGANVIGQVMFGFTYVLDLVLILDVIVSMKKAVVTSTGVCICILL